MKGPTPDTGCRSAIFQTFYSIAMLEEDLSSYESSLELDDRVIDMDDDGVLEGYTRPEANGLDHESRNVQV